MRKVFPCAALALLAGCSVVPPAAWTFDPARPAPKAALSVQELAVLTDRVAQLQLERNGIRTRIAGESNVWERQRLYAQLHSVGMKLSPLERRLAGVAAGR
jgi:uncharacterized lipoprotein YajG